MKELYYARRYSWRMPPSNRLTRLWPAAGINVRAGELEFRWIDDEMLLDLADLAVRGVHDPGQLPFTFPWTQGTELEVARRLLTYHWSVRKHVGPGSLVLELAVLHDGIPVGIQAVSGEDWAILRSVETGSWLGKEFHGRGIGTRMRALMLHVCFEGLGAAEVTSTAYEDNPASNAISNRVGYEPDGMNRVVRDGKPQMLKRYRMTRERWELVQGANANLIGAPVEMTGFKEFRKHLDG